MRPPARNTRSARVPTGNDAIAPIKDAHGAQNASHTGQTTASSKKDHRTSGKTKKSRHRMTNQQLDRLEALYQKSTHPSRQAKQELGEQVGM